MDRFFRLVGSYEAVMLCVTSVYTLFSAWNYKRLFGRHSFDIQKANLYFLNFTFDKDS